MAHSAEDECDGEWEEAQGVDYAKGRASIKVKDIPRFVQTGYGNEGTCDVLYKCHNCEDTGHKTVNRGTAKEKGHGKKGVYRVDDETIEEEWPQYPADLEPRVVEEVRGDGVGQPSASRPDDLPPGLTDSESCPPQSMCFCACVHASLYACMCVCWCLRE